MRPQIKSAKPQILQDNDLMWTIEYIADPARGDKLRRWAHDQILDALHDESSGKCVYCEDLPEAVTWLHVEHLRPKAKFRDLVVAWENLAFACPQCNVAKSDYFSESEPVLNPYVDQPEEHLEFCGGLVRARDGSTVGYLSIRKLKLGRPGLVQARMEHIERVEDLIRVWHLLGPGEAKDEVKRQIWEMAEPNRRFSAVVEDHLTHIGFESV